MVETVPNRGGEDLINIGLRRNTFGVVVTIRTHPKVEEFMKRLSNGEVIGVTQIGRNWLTEYMDPTTNTKHLYHEGPLKAYDLQTNLDRFTVGNMYTDMNRLGQSLMENDLLNLSFLRLVGTSEGDGVKFLLRSVMSFQQMKLLRDHLQEAQNRFITEYIKTVEFVVTTASQTI